MPKADAMGLAPEKSAARTPGRPDGAGGLFLKLVFDFDLIAIFLVKSRKRRPWAYKREDRPKGVQIEGLPSRADNLTGSPENNLRISGGNIVTRYSRAAECGRGLQ